MRKVLSGCGDAEQARGCQHFMFADSTLPRNTNMMNTADKSVTEQTGPFPYGEGPVFYFIGNFDFGGNKN